MGRCVSLCIGVWVCVSDRGFVSRYMGLWIALCRIVGRRVGLCIGLWVCWSMHVWVCGSMCGFVDRCVRDCGSKLVC